MVIWEVMSYAAWIVSALLFLWILIDAFNVAKQYDEEFLMSSREGADELSEELSHH